MFFSYLLLLAFGTWKVTVCVEGKEGGGGWGFSFPPLQSCKHFLLHSSPPFQTTLSPFPVKGKYMLECGRFDKRNASVRGACFSCQQPSSPSRSMLGGNRNSIWPHSIVVLVVVINTVASSYLHQPRLLFLGCNPSRIEEGKTAFFLNRFVL